MQHKPMNDTNALIPIAPPVVAAAALSPESFCFTECVLMTGGYTIVLTKHVLDVFAVRKVVLGHLKSQLESRSQVR